jgi:hypothetical protein
MNPRWWPFWAYSLLGAAGGLLLGAGHAAEPLIANPGALASDWALNPEAAFMRLQQDFDALHQAHRDLQASISWAGWGATAGLGVLGLIRAFPGPAGAFAEFLYNFWAPKLKKQADHRTEVAAEGFFAVANVMRSFSKDTPLGHVLDKLERRLPEEVKRTYAEWEARAKERPPTDAEVAHTARIRARAQALAETQAFANHPPTDALDKKPPTT